MENTCFSSVWGPCCVRISWLEGQLPSPEHKKDLARPRLTLRGAEQRDGATLDAGDTLNRPIHCTPYLRAFLRPAGLRWTQ